MEMATDDSSVPPAMLQAIRAAAEEDHRAPGELVREALERYMEAREWKKILCLWGVTRKALGLTEEDVPRFVEEQRRAHRPHVD